MNSDDRILKSYVWHGDECYFVSTIERDSSAMYGGRYNETIVWLFDWFKQERGSILHQGEDCTGSIETHQDIVKTLYSKGGKYYVG